MPVLVTERATGKSFPKNLGEVLPVLQKAFPQWSTAMIVRALDEGGELYTATHSYTAEGGIGDEA